MRDALFDESMGPVAERTGRHTKRGLLSLSDAAAARRRMFPGEKGEDGSGVPDLVAVIEMIGAGIVEIHRLLDEPKPKRTGIEVVVSQGVAGDGGDVMDA